MAARNALSPKAASEALAQSLEDVRLQIVRSRDERAAVEGAPVSEAEALDRLARWCEALRGTAMRRIGAGRFTARHYREPPVADASDLLMGVAAAMIHDALAADIRRAGAVVAGLSEAERAARLAALDADLLALELTEEGIIRSAERGGFEILRRADADPRAVLAADEVLP